jgi:uncharacterized protein (DUF2062 family)
VRKIPPRHANTVHGGDYFNAADAAKLRSELAAKTLKLAEGADNPANRLVWLWESYMYERNDAVKAGIDKLTPEYIARGWAIGMFYGCLIPFGFQLICSIPTAFLLKGSKIGATVGTFFTNHFSIFIIYPLQCWVGNKIMGGDLTFEAIKQIMKDLLEKQNYDALFSLGWELVCAFFIGGALLTAIMTPITYFFVKRLVAAFQAKKAQAALKTKGA